MKIGVQVGLWYDLHSPNPASVVVYLRLKEEWIDIWRPAVAGPSPDDGPNVYFLKNREIPQDELQGFWIGHLVRCAPRRFGKGTALEALERVQQRW